MIRINLLPHREMKRAARQRQFVFLAVGAVVVGAGIVVLAHTFIASQIDNQKSRNELLKAENGKLDKQIEEIKVLKEQTQALLARKQVVETLQSNRAEVVRLLDALARQIPDGVYLKGIKQTGAKVNLSGFAQSSARVSTLMRNLEATKILLTPELVEIKAVTVNNQRLNEFSLNVTIQRAAPTTAPAATAKSPAAANPGGVKP
ncbi:MAG: PilN domain-containing protein [Burkholderiales bacterium]|nr:MAG: PilN domain-containing protein [Burkholderiales bacterium]